MLQVVGKGVGRGVAVLRFALKHPVKHLLQLPTSMLGSASRGGSGWLIRRSFITASGDGPEKGVLPESISYSITPTA